MISDFYQQVVRKQIRTGIFTSHQNFGEMIHWNSNFHTIILECGFAEEMIFFCLPFFSFEKMTYYVKRTVLRFST